MTHARVLIIDTDRRLRTQLYTRLLDVDIFSDAVSNANEAIEYLRDRNYGLILLDLDLMNDEAFTVIDQVRLLPIADRPMVLATASRDGRTSVDPELVQIVIRKPLRLVEVADMIRSCVGSTRELMPRREERADRSFDLIGGDQGVVSLVT
jgi:DNA-binding NtrC family response regulator